MPLWLWGVVIAVLTVSAILVVGALGGHWAVVTSITGDLSSHTHACPEGRRWSRNLDGTYGCGITWQEFYVVGGFGAFAFVVIYRWTIGRRRSR